MASPAPFDSAVNLVRDSIGRIGDAVIEPVVEPNGPARTIGFVVQRDSYRYQVVGHPGEAFFHVVFPFSVVNQLEGVITEDDALEILDETADAGGDATHRAARTVLDQLDEDERDALVYNLVIVLSSEGAAFTLEYTESGVVAGFQVFAKVFPYEEQFSLAEFNRTVEAVVNTGISAMILVNLAFDFPTMVDTGDAAGMPPWYIY